MARRISLVIIILAISLGSGHLVQSRVAHEKAMRTIAGSPDGNG